MSLTEQLQYRRNSFVYAAGIRQRPHVNKGYFSDVPSQSPPVLWEPVQLLLQIPIFSLFPRKAPLRNEIAQSIYRSAIYIVQKTETSEEPEIDLLTETILHNHYLSDRMHRLKEKLTYQMWLLTPTTKRSWRLIRNKLREMSWTAIADMGRLSRKHHTRQADSCVTTMPISKRKNTRNRKILQRGIVAQVSGKHCSKQCRKRKSHPRVLRGSTAVKQIIDSVRHWN